MLSTAEGRFSFSLAQGVRDRVGDGILHNTKPKTAGVWRKVSEFRWKISKGLPLAHPNPTVEVPNPPRENFLFGYIFEISAWDSNEPKCLFQKSRSKTMILARSTATAQLNSLSETLSCSHGVRLALWVGGRRVTDETVTTSDNFSITQTFERFIVSRQFSHKLE